MTLFGQWGRRGSACSGPPSLDPTPHPLDFIWLELTPKCNQECIHCYASASETLDERLASDDWISILRAGSEAGCKGVQFIGGEPTLYDGLASLIGKSRELGYDYVEVFTNATRLTDLMLDELEAHGVQVATSFYSCSPETHDSITQAAGSFRSTVDGIVRIVGKDIPLRVGLIRLPENVTQMEETTDFLVELGVPRDRVIVDRVRGHGRAESIVNEHNEYSGLCGHCGDGRLAVAYDGSIYPCVHARRFKLGSALEDSLGEIATGPEMFEFRKAMLANLDETVRKTLLDDPHPARF